MILFYGLFFYLSQVELLYQSDLLALGSSKLFLLLLVVRLVNIKVTVPVLALALGWNHGVLLHDIFFLVIFLRFYVLFIEANIWFLSYVLLFLICIVFICIYSRKITFWKINFFIQYTIQIRNNFLIASGNLIKLSSFRRFNFFE